MKPRAIRQASQKPDRKVCHRRWPPNGHWIILPVATSRRHLPPQRHPQNVAPSHHARRDADCPAMQIRQVRVFALIEREALAQELFLAAFGRRTKTPPDRAQMSHEPCHVNFGPTSWSPERLLCASLVSC